MADIEKERGPPWPCGSSSRAGHSGHCGTREEESKRGHERSTHGSGGHHRADHLYSI